MKKKIRDFLDDCRNLDFGGCELLKSETAFYQRFNKEILSLCRSLPGAAQTDAILFVMRYSGVNLGDELDFFANYYSPAWSILYWLSRNSTLPTKRLEREDIRNAVTGQTMAMFLHSLDDHLTDGQVPASHLTLLLRSEAWRNMGRAFCSLAEGIPGGGRTIRRFLDDYYSGIRDANGPKSLDNYCDLFRKQMATWMIAPILVSIKMTGTSNFTRDIEKAYGSFGIAWRLLDDIQDIGKDIEKGSHSSLYYCLPVKIRAQWNNHTGTKETAGNHKPHSILNHIMESALVDKIEKRILTELETAIAIVQTYEMSGLARELRKLAHPIQERRKHREQNHGNPGMSREI